MVSKEYYAYDTNSFIADVGGYLGLCLGFSLLSFFDLGIEFGNWLIAKKYFIHSKKVNVKDMNI